MDTGSVTIVDIPIGLRPVGSVEASKYWLSETAPRTYATHRLTGPAAEVRRLYHVRAQSEEVIRVCKDQLALSGCQARSERAQRHHITGCLVAFCVLERERHDRHLSIDRLKQQLSFKDRSLVLPALERLRNAA
jgi:hypothetical protein